MAQFKTFLNETPWTAEDADEYIMRQSVIVVDDNTDRATIPNPHEGMVVYNKTPKRFEVFDGINWQAEGVAAVGTFTCPNSTGNYSVTGVGFKPKLVEFTVSFTNDGQGSLATGATDGINQWAMGMSTRTTSSPTKSAAEVFTDACIMGMSIGASGNVGLQVKGSIVSFDPDGFTLNFSMTASTRICGWKAFA